MYTMRFTIMLTAIGFSLVSCEKELNMNLTVGSKDLVVEGIIEQGEFPYVLLTKSMGFFDKIDVNTIEFVRGATVTVQDINSGYTTALKEYALDTTIASQRFTFVVYAPDYMLPGIDQIRGRFDHLYKLTVTYNAVSYEAVTKIPESTGLDSLWLEPVPGKEDKFSILKAMYKDPGQFG
jgi:hypothetical protein